MRWPIPQRPNHLYQNNSPAVGNTNHWLKVKLNGQASNRSGIGAKIRVKATIAGRDLWQMREMTGNGYSQTCPGLVAHFGLGDAAKADIVRVEWPSGNVPELTDVTAGQAGQALLTITEQVFITPVRPSSSLGGSVTLTSQRAGTWQWYHDGVALDGQNGRTLALSSITTNNTGRYSVVVETATGTFTRVTLGSLANDLGLSIGCAWADYDNNGFLDLFVTSDAGFPEVLYQNHGTAKLWDAETGQLVMTLTGHYFRVSAVGFLGDGQRLWTAERFGGRVWDKASGQLLRIIDGYGPR
jgi:hypothetical protein